jgi:hypothetical protein
LEVIFTRIDILLENYHFSLKKNDIRDREEMNKDISIATPNTTKDPL